MLIKVTTVINFALFHFLWPACIFGAAAGVVWPGILLLVAFIAWHYFSSSVVAGDWLLMFTMLIVGMLLDTLWVQTGLLDYATAWPSDQLAPIWIGVLWMGFALALNHSLGWMQKSKWLASSMLLIGSPLSYYCASKFGAVTWLAPTWQVVLATGVSWFFLMALFLSLAQRWRSKPVLAT